MSLSKQLPSSSTWISTRCMHRTRPLPDTHPEFNVIHWPGFTEYRVEHWRLARDGSGRVVRGTCVWSWVDVVVLLVVGILMTRFGVRRWPFFVNWNVADPVFRFCIVALCVSCRSSAWHWDRIGARLGTLYSSSAWYVPPSPLFHPFAHPHLTQRPKNPSSSSPPSASNSKPTSVTPSCPRSSLHTTLFRSRPLKTSSHTRDFGGGTSGFIWPF